MALVKLSLKISYFTYLPPLPLPLKLYKKGNVTNLKIFPALKRSENVDLNATS